MKIKNVFKRFNITTKFLLSFSVLIFVQTVSFLLIYSKVTQEFYKASIEIGLVNIKKTSNTFESAINEINKSAIMFINQKEVVDFARLTTLEPADYIKMKDILHLSSLQFSNNRFIKNLFIWFENSKALKTDYSFCVGDSAWQANLYKFDNSDYSRFFQNIIANKTKISFKSTMLNFLDNQYSSLFFVNTDDIFFNNPKIAYAIGLDMEKVVSDFAFLPQKYLNNFAIIDSNGNMLYQLRETGDKYDFTSFAYDADYITYNKNSNVLLYYKSRDLNFLYLLDISQQFFSEYYLTVKKLLILIFIMFFFISSIASYYLSLINYWPIRAILHELTGKSLKPEKTERINEFDFISDAIKNMRSENVLLGKESSSNKLILKDIFETDIKESSVYYPVETELKLINACISGNYDLAAEVIDELFRNNFSAVNDESVVRAKCLRLTINLRSTVIRILSCLSEQALDNVEINSHFTYKYVPVDTFRNNLKRVCENICFFVIQKKSRVKDVLFEEIVTYVNANYVNPDLSLSHLSDRFKTSENNVSRIFKENSEQNYASYVENLRLTMAMELITQTKLPFSEIAVKSGYSNANSFYKAFKRVYNASPGSFRIKQ